MALKVLVILYKWKRLISYIVDTEFKIFHSFHLPLTFLFVVTVWECAVCKIRMVQVQAGILISRKWKSKIFSTLSQLQHRPTKSKTINRRFLLCLLMKTHLCTFTVTTMAMTTTTTTTDKWWRHSYIHTHSCSLSLFTAHTKLHLMTGVFRHSHFGYSQILPRGGDRYASMSFTCAR